MSFFHLHVVKLVVRSKSPAQRIAPPLVERERTTWPSPIKSTGLDTASCWNWTDHDASVNDLAVLAIDSGQKHQAQHKDGSFYHPLADRLCDLVPRPWQRENRAAQALMRPCAE
jgi:hypothetical protein